MIIVSLASHEVNSIGGPMQDVAVILSWGGSAPVQVKHGWTDIWGMYGFSCCAKQLVTTIFFTTDLKHEHRLMSID